MGRDHTVRIQMEAEQGVMRVKIDNEKVWFYPFPIHIAEYLNIRTQPWHHTMRVRFFTMISPYAISAIEHAVVNDSFTPLFDPVPVATNYADLDQELV